jgi:broad specificity phosphatase PhoE
MTELWLLRHGQTDWNVEGRWQGQSPRAPGINQAGRAQALAALETLKGARVQAVYSSDLPRARQTAELVAASLGLDVTLEPRLREIDLGEWEGMLYEEIAERFPRELAEREADRAHSSAPGGELPAEVAARVLAAAADIVERHPQEAVLVVSHGVALAAIVCRAMGRPIEAIYEHLPHNAEPIRVEWQPQPGR